MFWFSFSGLGLHIVSCRVKSINEANRSLVPPLPWEKVCPSYTGSFPSILYKPFLYMITVCISIGRKKEGNEKKTVPWEGFGKPSCCVEFYMYSPCLRGFYLGSPVSFHLSKYSSRWIGLSKSLCISMLVPCQGLVYHTWCIPTSRSACFHTWFCTQDQFWIPL